MEDYGQFPAKMLSELEREKSKESSLTLFPALVLGFRYDLKCFAQSESEPQRQEDENPESIIV
jgi:hypothetical protein